MAQKKFLSGIDLGSQQIKNVADGSAATDAVNLQQLQSYVKGLSWKQAVRVKDGGSNITLTAPGATINGITMNVNDRFLLANQTTASQNGIYIWTGAATTATRALDATDAARAPDGVQTLTGGMTVYVESGTINADTAWTLTTDDPIVVETTALAFAQLGGGTTYTASSTGGLSLSSGAFSVKLPTSSGLITDSTGLYLDSTIAVKKYAVNVGDGTSTSITITHNLATRDVIVDLYDSAAYNEVETDVVHTTTNTVVLNFATAPASNAYRCVVHA
jgi:hypothetical protein